jgi:hypothetical protein
MTADEQRARDEVAAEAYFAGMDWAPEPFAIQVYRDALEAGREEGARLERKRLLTLSTLARDVWVDDRWVVGLDYRAVEKKELLDP